MDTDAALRDGGDGAGGSRAAALGRALLRVGSTVLGVVALAAVLFLAVGPHVLGYRTVTMRTGSMVPVIDPGDVVVIRAEPAADLATGQLLTFAAPVPGSPVLTHRVAEVRREAGAVVVRTRGDANPGPDPWQARISTPEVWHAVAVVPWVGRVVAALHHPAVRALTVWLIPAALCLEVLLRLWRRPARAGAVA